MDLAHYGWDRWVDHYPVVWNTSEFDEDLARQFIRKGGDKRTHSSAGLERASLLRSYSSKIHGHLLIFIDLRLKGPSQV